MSFNRVKGSFDIVPGADELWKDPSLWHLIEEKVHTLARLFNLQEIRTPIFEHTEVFTRSSGEASDIISKEMYTFLDKGERSLSLRPEITAPFVRAFIENHLEHRGYRRFYYMGPCFRYDRSQKGRYRQFHQLGIELVGEKNPYVDAEGILFLVKLLHDLGIHEIHLRINTIGTPHDRALWIKAFKDYLTPLKSKLSQDSIRRLEINPLRILDSKEVIDQEILKDAPPIDAFLNSESITYFQRVQEALDTIGLSFSIDKKLVRGLDYYTDTVFEIVRKDDTSSQNSLGGGGRYDGLMKSMHGPDLSAFGFAAGIERILQAIPLEQNPSPEKKGVQYFFIPMNDDALKIAFTMVNDFRQKGQSCELYTKGFNLKKGLKIAEESHAEFAVLIGEEELKNQKATLKNLSSREEAPLPIVIH